MLWGPKELRKIPCNLPTPGHTTFIGRQKEIADLLKLISPEYAANLISVDGIGGVGKTALALEVTYRCLQTSTGEVHDRQVHMFDAILFVTAKQQYLTFNGLLSGAMAHRTLHDLFREVALVMDRYEIMQTSLQDQPSRVRDALSRQRTLLIVDNLETMEDKQEIMAFLFRLPPQVKVVITIRERTLYAPIRLEELEAEEALHLIEKEAQEKGLSLSWEQALKLYHGLGGIPAALVYAIGQIASGYSVATVLDRVRSASGDVARFCFEGSIAPLRGKVPHTLLTALALFPQQPIREAIAHTAGLLTDPLAVEDGLAQLQRLSLVSLQDGRYRMLPLTCEYALAELAANPSFEREARARWIEWYMKLSEEYGGKDWREWHIQFDRVEAEWENLLAVFDWCAEHERYEELRAFWQPGQGGTGGVHEVAHIYGYWNDRLTWARWLLQAAERRGDWSTAVRAMLDIGFTITLMGRLEEADELLSRAWNLREHTTAVVQVNIAQEIADLRNNQRQFTEAFLWLDRANYLLQTTQIDEPERTRRKSTGLYYYSIACYRQQNYELAEMTLREMIECSQSIHWQRAAIYAQNLLADTAIALNQLDEAEDLLQTGLPVAERNKDKRRTASYKRSYAYLRQKQGNIDEARYYADAAYDGFERLGMQLEAEEMRTLLQQLQA
jgi:tetratricopeptide (TPR) repeat protein